MYSQLIVKIQHHLGKQMMFDGVVSTTGVCGRDEMGYREGVWQGANAICAVLRESIIIICNVRGPEVPLGGEAFFPLRK